MANINRRNFIFNTLAGISVSTLAAYGFDLKSDSKPLKVALIGAGWYGKSDLFRLIQVADIEVVALCDVDKNILEAASKLVANRQKSKAIPKLYGDYRSLLKENKLDLVLIGTPDHWHALQTIDAIKSGAHVYVQKPISVDVLEGEAMVAAARKYNKIVQVGTQRKSTPHLIEAKNKIVDAGLLGRIKHVEMCCYYSMRNNTNPPTQPIPDFLDYEMWTGPAPLRPYDGLPHIGWWRAHMEYGNGITGDMCVHMYDTVRWMLKLGWPKKISATGGIFMNKEAKSNIADTQTAIFEHDELNCVWTHRSWGTSPNPEYPWSFAIYGEKGTLWGSTMKADFIPLDPKGEKIHFDVLLEKEQYPEDITEERIELNAAPATRLHMKDFLKAVQSNTRPIADIEEGHISTACCILANMSMKLGRPLVYDPTTKTVKNDKQATNLLARKYRGPWVHPNYKKV
jgi:predicted dehydrogenase